LVKKNANEKRGNVKPIQGSKDGNGSTLKRVRETGGGMKSVGRGIKADVRGNQVRIDTL